MIVGEGRHCAAAIISPNFSFIRKYIVKAGGLTNQQLIDRKDVEKVIRTEVEKVNAELGKTEQIKKTILVPDEWSIETGELSAIHKLKRNIILSKYALQIQQLYRDDDLDIV